MIDDTSKPATGLSALRAEMEHVLKTHHSLSAGILQNLK
jgi:hypothetical protein